jgi:hypothetical protein
MGFVGTSEAQLDQRQAFQALLDPRFERNKRHALEDILILTVYALICDADTWIDVEEFGQAKHAPTMNRACPT